MGLRVGGNGSGQTDRQQQCGNVNWICCGIHVGGSPHISLFSLFQSSEFNASLTARRPPSLFVCLLVFCQHLKLPDTTPIVGLVTKTKS